MCRSPDFCEFRVKKMAQLKIKAIFLKLMVFKRHKTFPNSVTLVLLPRINGNALEINNSLLRSHSPGFLTLHRIVSADSDDGVVTYGSMDRVNTGDAIGFEVYFGEEKILRGVIRRNVADGWKIDCRCEVRNVAIEVSEAELQVGIEGHGLISEMVAIARRRKRRVREFVLELADIPEEMENDVEFVNGGCLCSVGDSDSWEEEERWNYEMEIEIQRLRWAIDLGIWITCVGLGLGYLVSKASFKPCRPRRWR